MSYVLLVFVSDSRFSKAKSFLMRDLLKNLGSCIMLREPESSQPDTVVPSVGGKNRGLGRHPICCLIAPAFNMLQLDGPLDGS